MLKIVILLTKRSVIHLDFMVIKVMNANFKKNEQSENDKSVVNFSLNINQVKIEKSI